MEAPGSPLTLWKCPSKYNRLSESKRQAKRAKQGIIAVGHDVPPLIKKLRSMGLPKPLLKQLKKLGISKLWPLQMQALPSVLSNRHTFVLSHQRAGKSLCFLLPLIMGAFEEERRLPFIENEGPVGLIVVPSRELGIQLQDFIDKFLSGLHKFPRIRSILCIGGHDVKRQRSLLQKGVHIMIATPGRLAEMLHKREANFSMCKTVVLDEADRLLDSGFEEEVKNLFLKLPTVQVIALASSVPKNLQAFMQVYGANPIYIGLERKLLKKLNLKQTLHFIEPSQKQVELLELLQKTDPPVLIFCESKASVDSLTRFFNERSIETRALHGSKTQQERSEALKSFRNGACDILIATEVAAKGLDFKKINHLINFDLPRDFESYIQRISRVTPSGIVSSYFSYTADYTFLTQLKQYFEGLGEGVPRELEDTIDEEPQEVNGACAYCHLAGHTKFFCRACQEMHLTQLLPSDI